MCNKSSPYLLQVCPAEGRPHASCPRWTLSPCGVCGMCVGASLWPCEVPALRVGHGPGDGVRMTVGEALSSPLSCAAVSPPFHLGEPCLTLRHQNLTHQVHGEMILGGESFLCLPQRVRSTLRVKELPNGKVRICSPAWAPQPSTPGNVGTRGQLYDHPQTP